MTQARSAFVRALAWLLPGIVLGFAISGSPTPFQLGYRAASAIICGVVVYLVALGYFAIVKPADTGDGGTGAQALRFLVVLIGLTLLGVLTAIVLPRLVRHASQVQTVPTTAVPAPAVVAPSQSPPQGGGYHYDAAGNSIAAPVSSPAPAWESLSRAAPPPAPAATRWENFIPDQPASASAGPYLHQCGGEYVTNLSVVEGVKRQCKLLGRVKTGSPVLPSPP